MKKLILHIILSSILSTPLLAQPQAFKYSALAIDADGQPITGDICVRFTLHEDSENGTVRYVEIHQASPGNKGKFNLEVGRGTPSSSFEPFASLDWANHQYWMRVALSFNCIDFTTQGVSQLLSVPYALYAGKAGAASNDSDTDATNELQQLYLNGNTLGLSQNGGEVMLPPDDDAQTLSISGNQVTISNGNTITLPPEGDGDPGNEIQGITLMGNTLFLSQNGGAVSLPLNTDSQALSINGNQLSISGGNTITLPADADADPANEIQQLAINGNMLSLSENGGSVLLPPDSDSQSLSLYNNQLTISGGNTITLPPEVDGDPSNEIQEISIDGNTIRLSQDGGFITLPVGTDSQALSLDGDQLSISGGNSITLPAGTAAQTLSLNGDQLTISGGNAITLPADGDSDSTNEIQELSLDGNTLKLSENGGSVTLPAGTAAQTLSLDGDQLAISGGNSITLPADSDRDSTNEIQALSIDGDTILLSQNGGSIILPADADVDATNEIQSLSIDGDTILLSQNGGSVILPADADKDATNEIQSLTIDGNTILLSQNGGSITLPVGTDSQALSLNGNQLTISGGNTITLPANTDAQSLSLNGNQLSISNGNQVDLPVGVTDILGGTGISTSATGGSVTVIAENSAPIWNAGQLEGQEIEDALPGSARVFVYDPAQGNGEYGFSSADSDISVEVDAVTGDKRLNVSSLQGLPINFSSGIAADMVLTCTTGGSGGLQFEGKTAFDGLTLPYAENVNLDVPMFSIINSNIITPDLIGMNVDNRGRYGVKGVSREGQSNFNSNLSAFDNAAFTYPAAVFGEHINASEAGVGVFGKAVSSFDSEGIGGLFMGKHSGVLAVAYDGGLGAVVGYGVGVRAGYFRGDVRITDNLQIDDNLEVFGSVNANVKNFKIDHPQDPANKYLYHTSVESPDMKNIYDGLATTGPDGYATVELPPYFEDLNKDCRYQLTCIGEFAQAIIAKKTENNRFVIRTDKPNVEVSWQVTGIRKDPYAEAHRTVPEVEKPDNEKGTYLHPELYGHPEAKRAGGE